MARDVARMGLSRLVDMQPPKPINLYDRVRVGALLHIDTKRLSRIDGMFTASSAIAGSTGSRARPGTLCTCLSTTAHA